MIYTGATAVDAIDQLFCPDYRTFSTNPDQSIQWEKLNLEKHITSLYQWVQLPYAITYWQMNHLSFAEFENHYQVVLTDNRATSLIGYHEGKMVCQAEIYKCLYDEIAGHYMVGKNDVGIHFLMAPVEQISIPGLSLVMMKSLIDVLFSIPEVIRIMGEPDAHNTKANLLVQKAGFHFLCQAKMSYKIANLYQFLRQ